MTLDILFLTLVISAPMLSSECSQITKLFTFPAERQLFSIIHIENQQSRTELLQSATTSMYRANSDEH